MPPINDTYKLTYEADTRPLRAALAVAQKSASNVANSVGDTNREAENLNKVKLDGIRNQIGRLYDASKITGTQAAQLRRQLSNINKVRLANANSNVRDLAGSTNVISLEAERAKRRLDSIADANVDNATTSISKAAMSSSQLGTNLKRAEEEGSKLSALRFALIAGGLAALGAAAAAAADAVGLINIRGFFGDIRGGVDRIEELRKQMMELGIESAMVEIRLKFLRQIASGLHLGIIDVTDSMRSLTTSMVGAQQSTSTTSKILTGLSIVLRNSGVHGRALVTGIGLISAAFDANREPANEFARIIEELPGFAAQFVRVAGQSLDSVTGSAHDVVAAFRDGRIGVEEYRKVLLALGSAQDSSVETAGDAARSLRDYITDLKTAAAFTVSNVLNSTRYSDVLGKLGAVFRGVVNRVSDFIDRFDIVENVLNGVARATEFVGNAFRVFSILVRLAFRALRENVDVVDFFSDAFSSLRSVFVAVAKGLLAVVATVVFVVRQLIRNVDVVSFFTNTFAAVRSIFANVTQAVITMITSIRQSIPTFDFFGTIARGIAIALAVVSDIIAKVSSLIRRAAETVAAAVRSWASYGDELTDVSNVGRFFQSVLDGVREAITNIVNVIKLVVQGLGFLRDQIVSAIEGSFEFGRQLGKIAVAVVILGVVSLASGEGFFSLTKRIGLTIAGISLFVASLKSGIGVFSILNTAIKVGVAVYETFRSAVSQVVDVIKGELSAFEALGNLTEFISGAILLVGNVLVTLINHIAGAATAAIKAGFSWRVFLDELLGTVDGGSQVGKIVEIIIDGVRRLVVFVVEAVRTFLQLLGVIRGIITVLFALAKIVARIIEFFTTWPGKIILTVIGLISLVGVGVKLYLAYQTVAVAFVTVRAGFAVLTRVLPPVIASVRSFIAALVATGSVSGAFQLILTTVVNALRQLLFWALRSIGGLEKLRRIATVSLTAVRTIVIGLVTIIPAAVAGIASLVAQGIAFITNLSRVTAALRAGIAGIKAFGTLAVSTATQIFAFLKQLTSLSAVAARLSVIWTRVVSLFGSFGGAVTALTRQLVTYITGIAKALASSNLFARSVAAVTGFLGSLQGVFAPAVAVITSFAGSVATGARAVFAFVTNFSGLGAALVRAGAAIKGFTAQIVAFVQAALRAGGVQGLIRSTIALLRGFAARLLGFVRNALGGFSSLRGELALLSIRIQRFLLPLRGLGITIVEAARSAIAFVRNFGAVRVVVATATRLFSSAIGIVRNFVASFGGISGILSSMHIQFVLLSLRVQRFLVPLTGFGTTVVNAARSAALFVRNLSAVRTVMAVATRLFASATGAVRGFVAFIGQAIPSLSSLHTQFVLLSLRVQRFLVPLTGFGTTIANTARSAIAFIRNLTSLRSIFAVITKPLSAAVGALRSFSSAVVGLLRNAASLGGFFGTLTRGFLSFGTALQRGAAVVVNYVKGLVNFTAVFTRARAAVSGFVSGIVAYVRQSTLFTAATLTVNQSVGGVTTAVGGAASSFAFLGRILGFVRSAWSVITSPIRTVSTLLQRFRRYVFLLTRPLRSATRFGTDFGLTLNRLIKIVRAILKPLFSMQAATIAGRTAFTSAGVAVAGTVGILAGLVRVLGSAYTFLRRFLLGWRVAIRRDFPAASASIEGAIAAVRGFVGGIIAIPSVVSRGFGRARALIGRFVDFVAQRLTPLALIIEANWTEVLSVIGSGIEGLRQDINDFAAFLIDLIFDAVDALESLLDRFQSIGQAARSVGSFFSDLFGGGGGEEQQLDSINASFAAIGVGAEGAGVKVAGGFNSIRDSVAGFFAEISAAGTGVGNFFANIGDSLIGFRDGFVNAFRGARDSVTSFFGELGDDIGGFTHGIRDTISSAIDFVVNLFQRIKTAVSEFFGGVESDAEESASGFTRAWRAISDAASGVFRAIGVDLTGFFGGIRRFARDVRIFFKDIIAAIQDFVEDSVDTIGDFFNRINPFYEQTFTERVLDALPIDSNKAKDAIRDLGRTVSDADRRSRAFEDGVTGTREAINNTTIEVKRLSGEALAAGASIKSLDDAAELAGKGFDALSNIVRRSFSNSVAIANDRTRSLADRVQASAEAQEIYNTIISETEGGVDRYVGVMRSLTNVVRTDLLPNAQQLNAEQKNLLRSFGDTKDNVQGLVSVLRREFAAAVDSVSDRTKNYTDRIKASETAQRAYQGLTEAGVKVTEGFAGQLGKVATVVRSDLTPATADQAKEQAGLLQSILGTIDPTGKLAEFVGGLGDAYKDLSRDSTDAANAAAEAIEKQNEALNDQLGLYGDLQSARDAFLSGEFEREERLEESRIFEARIEELREEGKLTREVYDEKIRTIKQERQLLVITNDAERDRIQRKQMIDNEIFSLEKQAISRRETAERAIQQRGLEVAAAREDQPTGAQVLGAEILSQTSQLFNAILSDLAKQLQDNVLVPFEEAVAELQAQQVEAQQGVQAAVEGLRAQIVAEQSAVRVLTATNNVLGTIHGQLLAFGEEETAQRLRQTIENNLTEIEQRENEIVNINNEILKVQQQSRDKLNTLAEDIVIAQARLEARRAEAEDNRRRGGTLGAIIGAIGGGIAGAFLGNPTLGVQLGSGIGSGIGGAIGGSFQRGGFTGFGNNNEIAGVVHRNEFVLPADVSRAIVDGRNVTIGALPPPPVVNIKFVNVIDATEMLEQALSTEEGEQLFVNYAQQNGFVAVA